MAKIRSGVHSNIFAGNHVSDYLSEHDKYLFAESEPEYKLNVIGAGMIGDEHIRVTMMEGRATVHGIYDTSERSMEITRKKFKERYGRKLVSYGTLEAVCSDPEVDGLIICTPNYTHIDIVREAVKSGKHNFLEKPMATTVKDAYEIRSLAEKHKAVFQIGLQYRYKPIYSEAIHETLHRKAIGDVKTISIMEHRVPFLDKVGQWNKFARYSGGTLVEKCCHYFDLFNLFARSRPAEVYASGSMAVNFTDFKYEDEKSDILDNATVIVTYENGIRATFNLCMFSPMFYEEIVLCGEGGRLKAYENEDFLPDARPGTHLEVLSGENGVSKISTPCYPAVIQKEGGHQGATYYEHKYFIDNMKGISTGTATVEEGFWSIIVGAAAEKSVQTGEIVRIDEWLKENGIA